MTDQMEAPVGEADEKPSKTWLIVLIVALVLCCLCLLIAAAGWALWNYGDQWLGLSSIGIASAAL